MSKLLSGGGIRMSWVIFFSKINKQAFIREQRVISEIKFFGRAKFSLFANNDFCVIKFV